MTLVNNITTIINQMYFSVSRGLGGLDTTSNLNQSIMSH